MPIKYTVGFDPEVMLAWRQEEGKKNARELCASVRKPLATAPPRAAMVATWADGMACTLPWVDVEDFARLGRLDVEERKKARVQVDGRKPQPVVTTVVML